jgi:decaprenylphospho-beta-D-ribofuranose 2-oxidase
MGLTGIVLDATIRLLPIETSRMSVDTHRLPDLDALMAAMADGDDDDYRYSVAWIDLAAKGRQMGRSVLTRGDHARLDQLPAKQPGRAARLRARQLVSVPPVIPPMGLLNHAHGGDVQRDVVPQGAARRSASMQSISSFFHPLDMVGQWNRVSTARRAGAVPVMVPFGQRRRCAASSSGVGQRHGELPRRAEALRPRQRGPAQLPAARLDARARHARRAPGLGELLHSLDDMVLEAGGRHYFAKDAHTTPETIRRGYPRLAEWQAVRDAVDPLGVWQSDLGRRLPRRLTTDRPRHLDQDPWTTHSANRRPSSCSAARATSVSPSCASC